MRDRAWKIKRVTMRDRDDFTQPLSHFVFNYTGYATRNRVRGQYRAGGTFNNANSPTFDGAAEEAGADFRSSRPSNYRNRFSFDLIEIPVDRLRADFAPRGFPRDRHLAQFADNNRSLLVTESGKSRHNT